ncbi:MAG: hypothetical protein LBB78_05160, partial [Spirochaetaceae bacterium]|nr:hypothetical protein [Spirochaetaceae bacterium]
KDFSGIITYTRTKGCGDIGENTESSRRITLENVVYGTVHIDLPNAGNYTFYTEAGNIFTIYRYNAFDGTNHLFESCEFTLNDIISKYNTVTSKAKEYILNHPRKNEVLTNAIYWNQKELGEGCNKTIEPDHCSIGHYYNRVIISFKDELKIDKGSSMVPNKTIQLGLYRE